MKTEVVAASASSAAVELLNKGEIVALPTETVYGLAADALNAVAAARIFEAKERPRFDPLIVHLPDRSWLERVAKPDDLSQKLIDEFWPGPLTIVLPKHDIVPGIVTAGLETVALRMSAHPVFSEIIREFGKPLAAPSANRFGHVSPTTAQHVLDELDGRIPLIVDAGPTSHGIESTIVVVRTDKIEILRRGPITEDELSPFAEIDAVTSETISAPGQLPTHYAPKTPLRLIDDADLFSPKSNERCALLAWKTPRSDGFPAVDFDNQRSGDRRSLKFIAVRQLSEKQDLREAAANLFRYLRELDAIADVDLIVAERVPDRGLGAAIMDRLRRAAQRSIAAPGKLQ